MMKSGLFLILLLVGSSLQLGTIYLDQITSNTDPITGESVLEVEGVDFDDTTLTLDYINGRESPGTGPGYGVNIEDSIHNEGNWFIPQHAVIEGDMTVWALFRPNGGIVCDDGNPDDDDTHSFEYSWKLFDDSGDLHILGELTPDGGINMNNLFFVENDSGRTYISGLTRPDGGINVEDNWTVNGDSGEIFSERSMSVEGNLTLGTEFPDTRMITRIRTSSASGGATFISAQDGGSVGGNLILEPGLAVGADNHGWNGRVIFGPLVDDYNLIVDRFPVNDNDGTKDAGQTIYSGQDGGSGGDIIFQAGNANGPFQGGDLELAVARPTGGGAAGDIILGGYSYDGDYGNRENFHYMVTRPKIVETYDAGTTIFRGQSFTNAGATVTSRDGDFFLIAGDSQPGGTSNMDYAGDLILSGGVSGTTTGTIYLGRSPRAISQTALNADLSVRRWGTVATDAARTHFAGQNASDRGGDLWYVAGNAAASGSFIGGDIFLETGSTTSGSFGWIILGDQLNNPTDLSIKRPSRSGARGVGTTSIFGQSSSTAAGGQLTIEAGDGLDWGGDLMLYGGVGDRTSGGDIAIDATDGSPGGRIAISAGNANNVSGSRGGFITIWAGASNQPNDVPGNVYFNAGFVGTGNPNNGRVVVNPNGNPSNFNVRATPFIYNQPGTARSFFIYNGNSNTISIGAVPSTRFIGSTSNNSNMLNDPNAVRVTYGFPTYPINFDTYPGNDNSLVYDYSSIVAAVTDTQNFLSALINTLANNGVNPSSHNIISVAPCTSGDCWDPQWGQR